MSVLLITFVILLVIGMPVSFVIGLSGLAFFAVTPDIPFSITVQRIVAQTQSYSFLAVPFFIFAGNLMNESGITKRLLGLASILTRRMYGGMAQVSVVMSTLMGGVSGSATADAAMETRILGPEMMKRGYTKGYITAVNCLTGLITATIPPSLGLILYGFIGEVSIGRLFCAGMVPGVLMMVVLMLTVNITSRVRGFEKPNPEIPKVTVSEVTENLKESIWALMFPVILIVGIRFGVCTPSEAGAFAVFYAIIVGAFVYHEFSVEGFVEALKTSMIDTAAVMLIVTLSGPFSYSVTYVNLPQKLSTFIFGITNNPSLLVIIILLFLFVMGMFLDSNVNFLLLTPIFLPMVTKLGVDPVHFGVLMATIVTMGVMTPPVGSALYTVCGILECPIEEYTKEAMPFFFAILLEMIVLVFLPDIVLFLPNLVYGTY
ncbi:TRAP transporter large permease [Enterocloster clostridioformis]|uniref:TRAP transporter, DctM subunit n=1 Tax=Enterocloster clostridioformis TaxID=1531 RepID=A0A1I0JE39_9FIRM|nr:TRAP transporter large permease [Enterocloster clostridioformis]SEU08124.1 TRAP transporter, DctM subunit [Enterocloster clostridioformis]SEW45374.1 TRAP transporter, DctM subunit [Enterocloster clostridioformis]